MMENKWQWLIGELVEDASEQRRWVTCVRQASSITDIIVYLNDLSEKTGLVDSRHGVDGLVESDLAFIKGSVEASMTNEFDSAGYLNQQGASSSMDIVFIPSMEKMLLSERLNRQELQIIADWLAQACVERNVSLNWWVDAYEELMLTTLPLTNNMSKIDTVKHRILTCFSDYKSSMCFQNVVDWQKGLLTLMMRELIASLQYAQLAELMSWVREDKTMESRGWLSCFSGFMETVYNQMNQWLMTGEFLLRRDEKKIILVKELACQLHRRRYEPYQYFVLHGVLSSLSYGALLAVYSTVWNIGSPLKIILPPWGVSVTLLSYMERKRGGMMGHRSMHTCMNIMILSTMVASCVLLSLTNKDKDRWLLLTALLGLCGLGVLSIYSQNKKISGCWARLLCSSTGSSRWEAGSEVGHWSWHSRHVGSVQYSSFTASESDGQEPPRFF